MEFQATLEIGTPLQLGKYVVEDIIGQGGFGITYLANFTLLNKKVAMKEFFLSGYCVRDVIKPTVIPQTIPLERFLEYKEKFIQEAQMLAQFDHPNIVRVMDVFQEHNTAYYVMEFIDGKTLSEHIEEKKHLTEDEAINIIAQAADALKIVHDAGFLHRDIKPENILITKSNHIKLIDFGSAREFTQNATKMHTIILTEGYAPIEQYSKMKKRGAYTDIYALAGTLYTCFVGRPPISAMDRDDTVDFPPDLPGISKNTMAVIRKGLAMKATDRFQSMEEFLATLLKKVPAKSENKQESKTVVEHKIHVEPVKENHPPKKSVLDYETVLIEGGSFEMGGTDYENEKPVHTVVIGSFYLGCFEVTQKLWNRIMGANPSKFKVDDLCPVDNISWNQIQEFIKKLNNLSNKNYRLPTEAEWEFAARGGIRSMGYKYSGSSNPDEVAWYKANAEGKTHPVGLKKPNELGLFDMSGNVWEWCADWFGSYSKEAQNNPKGAKIGKHKVLRGGSWYSDMVDLQCTFRYGFNPDYSYSNFGFRLAHST